MPVRGVRPATVPALPTAHRAADSIRARDHYSAVGPLILKRPSQEHFRHPIQDQSELMLRDASDQNAACVRSPFLGRLSQEGREVTDVKRHYDSLLFDRQSEHLGIVDALQVTALV